MSHTIKELDNYNNYVNYYQAYAMQDINSHNQKTLALPFHMFVFSKKIQPV